MSLLWGYDPRKCDGEYCMNDCGHCYKAEIEMDGFITRPEALERVSQKKAKPIKECAYPKCEECDDYHGHYCTVPMVISKQIYRLTDERLHKLENELMELKCLVTAEIIGSKERRHILHSTDPENLTWDVYLGEEK